MEIRRSQDGLISTMGFPVLVRWHHYIEPTPRCAPLTLRQMYIITQYHWCICDTYEEHWQALNYNKTKKAGIMPVSCDVHISFHIPYVTTKRYSCEIDKTTTLAEVDSEVLLSYQINSLYPSRCGHHFKHEHFKCNLGFDLEYFN